MPRRGRLRDLVVLLALTWAAGDAHAGGAGHERCGDCHGHRSTAPAYSTVVYSAGPDSARDTSNTVPCQDCHLTKDDLRSVMIGAIGHAALACTTCHDPHANDEPYRFRGDRIAASSASDAYDPETRLCVSCHSQMGQFRGLGGGFIRHPVGIGVARHDTHVVLAAAVSPSAVGDGTLLLPLVSVPTAHGAHDVIGCATCHALHDNRNAYYLRWSGAQEPTACSSCHQEAVSLGP